ncbi:hypothetical protein NC651_003514 [Populus alba x Populus x berolinensis]|nr:hypothetical protein NC651_003514 [Populus alba x Populus x berolinensis]
MVMASHTPPAVNLGGDEMYWRQSTSGNFTTQSTYITQMEVSSSQQTSHNSYVEIDIEMGGTKTDQDVPMDCCSKQYHD